MLQIRPINIQARLQETRDAASNSKQIAVILRSIILLSYRSCSPEKLSPQKKHADKKSM